jgi:hypothetical protein
VATAGLGRSSRAVGSAFGGARTIAPPDNMLSWSMAALLAAGPLRPVPAWAAGGNLGSVDCCQLRAGILGRSFLARVHLAQFIRVASRHWPFVARVWLPERRSGLPRCIRPKAGIPRHPRRWRPGERPNGLPAATWPPGLREPAFTAFSVTSDNQSVTGKRVDEKPLTILYRKNISGTSRSYIGGL